LINKETMFLRNRIKHHIYYTIQTKMLLQSQVDQILDF